MVRQPEWLTKLLAGRGEPKPGLPENQCVYAVGDVHGRYDLLIELLARIADDSKGDANTLIFLGDYIDRGPDSRKVVDLLQRLQVPGWTVVCLQGNHEACLLEFLNSPDVYPVWREIGAADTLLSYGVKPPVFTSQQEFARARDELASRLPNRHLDFFGGLAVAHAVGGYYFVHAGIRPGIPLDRQSPQEQLWIRDEFLLSDAPYEKIIVHGHSVSETPVVRRNRICVDTGAYATGVLTAVKLFGEGVSFISTAPPQSAM